jgi:hypothetical protein
MDLNNEFSFIVRNMLARILYSSLYMFQFYLRRMRWNLIRKGDVVYENIKVNDATNLSVKLNIFNNNFAFKRMFEAND